MKNFHLRSFGLGLASGLVILLLVIGGMRFIGGGGRNRGFGGGGMNITRMAQRLGMTEAEVQAELDSGKTMQQIAQEHGVQFGGGQGGPRSDASSASGSTSVSTSSLSAHSSSVSVP